MTTKHIGIAIDASFETVNDFLAVPENFPKWAAGLGSGIVREGDEWVIETPEGRSSVRFTPKNKFGVIDHTVFLASGAEIYVPLRVIRHGDGSEVVLTLFRLPEMTDANFADDAASVERDLSRLKTYLETSSGKG